MLRILVPIALLLAPIPFAAALAPPCTAQNVGGLDQPAYLFVPATQTFEVWTETNGIPGLQRGVCSSGGVDVAPDHRVGTFSPPPVNRCPIDLGGTPVCIVR